MIRVIGFAIAFGLLVLAALWRSPLPEAIDTDMFALLPNSSGISPLVEQATDHVRTTVERSHVFVIRHRERGRAREAALLLSSLLDKSDYYVSQDDQSKASALDEILSFFKPFQAGLLSDTVRLNLIQGRGEDVVVQAIRDIFSPLSFSRTTDITTDPFVFFPSFLNQLMAEAGTGLYLDEGFATFENKDGYHIILPRVLADSPFAIQFQEKVDQFLTDAEMRLKVELPGIHLTRTGVFEHTIRATKTAESEVQRVGSGSLIAVIVLLFLVFPGFKPLFGLVIPLGSGLIAGAAACLLVFGNIHLLTLISGGSLIGIAVDYSFHFLAHYHHGNGHTGTQSLKAIKKALWLGLMTSLVSFAGLLGSGFPGLQQIAIFSMAGLFAALLSVVIVYPVLFPAPARRTPSLPYKIIGYWTALWKNLPYRLVVIASTAGLGLIAAFTIPQLQFNDDVRLLNFRQTDAAPTNALEQITGGPISAQFFLVSSPDQDSVLQREEKLFPLLMAAKQRGEITGFSMLSRYVPSISRQKENRKLVLNFLERGKDVLQRFTDTTGISQDLLAQYRLSLLDENTPVLDLENMLSGPFSDIIKPLWIKTRNGEKASLVILKGVSATHNLTILASDLEGVEFVDYIQTMSATLGEYREKALWLILIAYIVILLLMYKFYGFRGLWISTLVFLGASILIGGTIVLSGDGLNLFHVMGGILVYGIGVDYIIFLLDADRNKEGPMLAISMSALTTILAFGLLSLSDMGALHAFGQSVLAGIIAVFLLASILIPDKR